MITTPADTTTTITVFVCPRCGSIGKSGKMSCCGRGGSWFKNCGGAGNTKLHHTWYEGIQACKARSQSKTVIGQQLNVAQQKGTDSSQGVGMANYKSVIAAIKTSVTSVNTSTLKSETTSIVTSADTPDSVSITTSDHMLMTNTSTNIEMIYTTHMSVSTSTTSQGCGKILKIIVHINLLFYHCVLAHEG